MTLVSSLVMRVGEQMDAQALLGWFAVAIAILVGIIVYLVGIIMDERLKRRHDEKEEEDRDLNR